MTSKKARSCDSCARPRARWYCAADDAFLCHGCDASVHSANPLATRHHRLQLRSAPNLLKIPGQDDDSCPAWQRGFTRKARTPRPHNKAASSLVPELETSEENNTNEEVVEEEEEQQLLYRVPVYDPVLDEYCEPAPTEESKPLAVQLADYNNCNSRSSSNNSSNCLVGFHPSDTELAEFAADMESLLGRGLENDSFSMEELGLGGDAGCGEQIVKEEELDENSADAGNTELYENMCLSRETLDIDFDDCGTPTTEEEDELERTKTETPVDEYQQRRKVGLRLDHQAIIAEWSVRDPSSSPWINGERPQFGPDDCWLDCMGIWGGGDQVQGLAQAEVGGGHVDEGREARVSRYREKRRTRLFSKKIRYEVRKLNAEKRPRMKGRFVKRTSFAAATPY